MLDKRIQWYPIDRFGSVVRILILLSGCRVKNIFLISKAFSIYINLSYFSLFFLFSGGPIDILEMSLLCHWVEFIYKGC